MNLSFLNKVPFLKDVDFNDETNRKKALVFAVGIFVLIGLIVYLYYPSGESTEQNTADNSPKVEAPVVQIQNGEDYDNIERTDNRTIYRAGNGQSLAEQLFGPKESPFGDAAEKAAGDSSAVSEQITEGPDASKGGITSVLPPTTSIRPGQPGVYPQKQGVPGLRSPSDFNISKEDIIKNLQGDETNAANPTKDREEELDRRERSLRDRERLIAMGINPDTNLPFDNGGGSGSGSYSGGSSATTQPAPEVTPPPQVAAIDPEIIVEETELDDDDSFGLGTTGISSLANSKKRNTEKLTIKVMFIDDKKVKSGDRVQIRLCENKGITVEGIHIPKGHILYANVNVGDRVFIYVPSINVNGRILPLNLEAYDVDGLRGIYCPTNETEQVLKEVGREAKEVVTGAIGGMMRSFGARFVTTGRSASDQLTNQTYAYITPGYSFDLMKAE